MRAPKTPKVKNLKKDAALVIACAAIMVAGGFLARVVKPEAKSPEQIEEIATAPLADHEAIKAEVLDDDPSHYMIDVEKFANINADDNAKTFAVYMKDSKPETCGDFRDLELTYEKPETHKRVFDLSDHPDVLMAIEHYGCIVMRNIPPNAS